MDRDQAHKQLELLKRIADALEKGNTTKAVELSGERNKDLSSKAILDVVKNITDDYASKHPVDKLQDVPGFEGTLDALHNIHPVDKLQGNLCDCGNDLEDKDVICESCEDEVHYTYKDEYTYDNKLRELHCGVVNDSDFNIRKTADSYQAALDCETHFTSKKDCIMDYITNEFGILGARYTDIIKFAYYLGCPNAPKYSNENRGYYSCAFNTRFGGHLIKGGKDQLVKGINNEGVERYFALSSVDSFTDYYKRIA